MQEAKQAGTELKRKQLSKKTKEAAQGTKDMHGLGKVDWTAEEASTINMENRVGEGMACPACQCHGTTMFQVNTKEQLLSVNEARARAAQSRQKAASASAKRFRNTAKDKEVTDLFVCQCWVIHCQLDQGGGNCPECTKRGPKLQHASRGMQICTCSSCSCSCSIACTRGQCPQRAAEGMLATQRDARKAKSVGNAPMNAGDLLNDMLSGFMHVESSPPFKRFKTNEQSTGDSGVYSAASSQPNAPRHSNTSPPVLTYDRNDCVGDDVSEEQLRDWIATVT